MSYIRNMQQIQPLSNLLNDVLHFGFTTLLKKMGKENKKMIIFWGKKADEKQYSATIMISVDGKGAVFPVKLKLQGNRLNKDI